MRCARVADMDALVEMPGKGLARPSPKGALALINQTLTSLLQPLQVAKQCEYIMRHDTDYFGQSSVTYLGYGNIKLYDNARFVGRAKVVLARLLPDFPKVDAACDALMDIFFGTESISPPAASKMLSILFGALSKRKTDSADGDVDGRLRRYVRPDERCLR
jgi:hypothetical protein